MPINKNHCTTEHGRQELISYQLNPQWVYFGGEKKGPHLNKWRLFCKEIGHNETIFPRKKYQCVCDHWIKESCFIFNKHTHKIKTVGSCCITKFEFKMLCWDCSAPHKNRTTTRCNKCR